MKTYKCSTIFLILMFSVLLRFYELRADNDAFDGLYSYNPCLPFDAPDKVSILKTGNVACKNAAVSSLLFFLIEILFFTFNVILYYYR